MVRAHILLLSLLSGLLASCDEKAARSAEASTVSRPVTEEEFLKALAQASRSGRPDAVRALVHPANLQQVEEHNRPFFLEWLSREVKRAIPEIYRATATAIAPDAPLPFEGPFVYPVRPTLSLQIDFDEPPRRSVSMIRSVLVDDDGVWWLVVALPTHETVARMQRIRSDADRTEQAAAELARNIEEPLRGELKTLLRNGRKIDAIKRYREVSGEGLRMAKEVAEVLEEEVRSTSTAPDGSR